MFQKFIPPVQTTVPVPLTSSIVKTTPVQQVVGVQNVPVTQVQNVPVQTTSFQQVPITQTGFVNTVEQQVVGYAQAPLSPAAVVPPPAVVPPAQPVHTSSRVEYIPYERSIVEMEEVKHLEQVPKYRNVVEFDNVETTEFIPHERKFTDYQPIEHITEQIPFTYTETYVDYVPVERFVDKVAYQEVTRQVVHPVVPGGQTGEVLHPAQNQFQTVTPAVRQVPMNVPPTQPASVYKVQPSTGPAVPTVTGQSTVFQPYVDAPPVSAAFVPPVATGFAPAVATGFAPAVATGFAPAVATSYAPAVATGFAPAVATGFAPAVASTVVPAVNTVGYPLASSYVNPNGFVPFHY